MVADRQVKKLIPISSDVDVTFLLTLRLPMLLCFHENRFSATGFPAGAVSALECSGAPFDLGVESHVVPSLFLEI